MKNPKLLKFEGFQMKLNDSNFDIKAKKKNSNYNFECSNSLGEKYELKKEIIRIHDFLYSVIDTLHKKCSMDLNYELLYYCLHLAFSINSNIKSITAKNIGCRLYDYIKQNDLLNHYDLFSVFAELTVGNFIDSTN